MVNDKRVTRHVLAEGDVIQIGETSIQFRREMKRG
jgi:pSer/pThr/pTyr-binding forkhead associated (FHA) protein